MNHGYIEPPRLHETERNGEIWYAYTWWAGGRLWHTGVPPDSGMDREAAIEELQREYNAFVSEAMANRGDPDWLKRKHEASLQEQAGGND